MARNRPWTLRSEVFPVFLFRIRTPATFQALLVREAKIPRVGSRGDDDGPGFVGSVGSPYDEGTFREIDFRHVVIHEVRFESLRLLAPELHELGSLDSSGEARIVFDVRSDHELSSRRGTGDHECLQPGSCGIDRGGEAGGP